MTDPSQSNSSARRSRLLPLLGALLALIVLVLGFTVASSLAAGISENRWWMLCAGVLCSVLVPAVLASWIRSLRRGKSAAASGANGLEVDATGRPATTAGSPGGRPRQVRQPSTVLAITLLNLLVVVGSGVLAPDTTRRLVGEHGAWWVVRIVTLVGGGADNPVITGTQGALDGLTGLLPGGTGASSGAGGEGGAAAAGGALGETQTGGAGGAAGGSSKDGARTDKDAGAGGVSSTSPDSAAGAKDAAPAVTGGAVRVAYKKQGTSIIIPVTLFGPAGAVPVKMLFDTGATLSTVDRVTLRKLGLSIALEDPTIQSKTANGMVRRKITVIDGVAIRGARVTGGVTVSHCEPCASGEVVGLLGLNVSRHFKVTLDDEDSQIILQPKLKATGHMLDIQPFIKLTDARGSWRGPMLTVRLNLHNQSRRPIRHLRLVAEVEHGHKTGRIWGEVRDVPPRASVPVKIEGLSPVKGERFQLKLESADW